MSGYKKEQSKQSAVSGCDKERSKQSSVNGCDKERSKQSSVSGYDKERLKQAQKASLDILIETDRLCRLFGIRYFLDSGTLLGAVRHKGFIPWDDDIDIVMPREDFERFRSVAAPQLRNGMELVMPDSFRNGTVFYDFTPRIIYINSRRHSEGGETDFYEGKLNHLWVDIFILDNISDNVAADRLTRFAQKAVYGMAMSKRYELDMSKYTGLDRLKVAVLSFAGGFVSMKTLFGLQHRLSTRYNGSRTRCLYYSNYQPDYIHDTVKREWIEETAELEFDGFRFFAPGGYDHVLREIYGDYMQLPPEEKRVPSHSDEIDILQEGEYE
ncbi:MAG: LicD family protein [Clostridiales bacterium]|nr:LicD family protein [Clostridiales bacterium]